MTPRARRCPLLLAADKEFDGDMWTREGLKVKYLPQEPDLDSSLNVMENIRRGIAEQVRRRGGGGTYIA